ncbi:MAG: hypothetical protein QHH30_00995 [candidate division NC10 bacterium]|nr:hypothetical protein [candidate division NC10 bacterium]
MKRISLLLVCASLLLCLSSGCATKIYDSPQSGSSADLQQVLANSIEEAFTSVPEEVWGHRISLQIAAPPGKGDALAAYIRQYLREIIAREGGSLEPPYDLQITILVPASGNFVTERRLSLTLNIAGAGNVRLPLFYGETFKGLTQTLILCRDGEGRLFQVLKGEQKRATHEIYWFWMLGPFESDLLPQF